MQKPIPPVSASQAEELYHKLTDINARLKEAREGVSGLISQSGVPDSAKHLDAVLRQTEEAATGIMDAVEGIRGIVNGSPLAQDAKDEVNALVTRVYEHCTFQDISGQRVKKVMKTLATVETISYELLKALRGGQDGGERVTELDATQGQDSLMNGPQLPEDAPCQEDIDKLFSRS